MILIDEILNFPYYSLQLKLGNNNLIVELYGKDEKLIHSFSFSEKNTIEITKKIQKGLSNEI